MAHQTVVLSLATALSWALPRVFQVWTVTNTPRPVPISRRSRIALPGTLAALTVANHYLPTVVDVNSAGIAGVALVFGLVALDRNDSERRSQQSNHALQPPRA